MELMGALADPVNFLNNQASPTESEISLDTLSDEEKDKIKRVFVHCRSIALQHYKDTIEPKILERRHLYNADKEYYRVEFPQLSENCEWTSKDIKTSCQWILPGLMDALGGASEPVSIKGVNIEDDDRAKNLQELIRYQLERKNNHHEWLRAELECALRENFGIAKVWWERKESRKQMEMMLNVAEKAKVAAIIEGMNRGKIEIVSAEPIPDANDLIHVVYDEVKLEKNQPVIEFVPNSEIRYTPDAPELQKCKFVAHRKIITGDYLKQRERQGIYKDIDNALEEYGRGNTQWTVLDRNNDFPRTQPTKRVDDGDLASREVELYEAYLNVDYNNDGIYEKIIVHAIGDHLIRVAKNDYEFPPFFVCETFKNPNKVFNDDCLADTLKPLQDLKTALMRQAIIVVAKNASPRLFVDEMKTDMDALMSGEELVPIQGNPNDSVFPSPQLPLPAALMTIVQYAQNEIEAQSGSTRYNQGLDSNSLNSTATGVTAIMGAADKRNRLMARTIAESFLIPIYKFIISLNQKYMDEEQIVRLTNQSVTIRREDLDIDYDLIVNVGEGASSREQEIQYLMYTLQSIYPQLTAQGIVNARSWFNLVSRLLEKLGLRDVTRYLMDPDSEEAQQAAAAIAAQTNQQRMEALQNSLQLSLAKSSVPRVSVDVKDMPPEARRQYYQQHFGIDVSEKAIAEEDVKQESIKALSKQQNVTVKEIKEGDENAKP